MIAIMVHISGDDAAAAADHEGDETTKSSR